MQHPITTDNPIELSTAKEGYYFDRKSARLDPRETARHLSAFANAGGGTLVIGIEDDGEITGFRRNKAHSVEDFEQAAITECEPSPRVRTRRIPVRNSKGQDDIVLMIIVAPSTNHVVRRRSDKAVFLRQEDRSVRLEHEQIVSLEYDKNQRSFEDEVCERSSIGDVDEEVVSRYKEALGTDVPAEQLLRSRGFLVDGRLTNAGVLLFSQNPTRFMPCARVRVLRFDGGRMETGRRLNIIKDRTFDGPIPKVIDDACAMISEQLRDFQYLGDDGLFKVVSEYPEFAWTEGLVNAVTHRDYSFAGDYIRVSLYDDRMEIRSPGALPNVVTLDNMRYTRYSRNPNIARVLAEMGWVKELNEGVKRIYDEMRAFYLHDPVYSEPNGAAVLLTLENSIATRVMRRQDALAGDIGQAAFDSLNEYELATMQYVYAKGRITVGELKELLGRSVKVARPTLRGLVDKGFLDWHGSSPKDPSQYYDLHR